MNKLWKRFEGWATAFKNSFLTDIFTAARIKITLLYLAMGVIILAIAGYLTYVHIISIVQTTIGIITQLLANKTPINEGIATNIILESVNKEVQNMNISVGLWIIFAMIISAYVFAGITLRPIRKAMERQKRFIANVSHELRTPLAIMKTGTEVTLLDAKELPNTELVDALKDNLEEVNRMARITEFLLDFSNMENRLSRLSFARVDLGGITANVVKLVEGTAAEKDIKITFVHDGPATIKGNPVALEEMVLNLVKNAISYTPPGGNVSVSVERRGFERYGRITLSIKDTGIGIPAEDLLRLFEPFYRGKNALPMHGNQSTGLGLAIVKEIAELHHAAISVKSDVGKGTTIAVRFASVA